MGATKENKIWHKSSLGDEDDAWTSNTRIARDTTLDDEKYDVHYTWWWQIERPF